MGRRDRDDDAAYGLTPREWLDTDPVPLTPDVDFADPDQRAAWIHANLEEMAARRRELAARGGGRAPGRGRDDDDGEPARPRMSATTVVPVRFLNAEQRALVRAARREGVSVSDLVRRWVRAALDPDPDPDRESEPDAQRVARAAAADAMVERIADEVRRLREIVVSGG